MLPLDGMAEVRSVRVPTSPPRILEETEEALLLREAAPALRGFIILAVETGLRRRALLSLKWEHVDLVSGRLDLPGDLLKSGRRLRVPLSQRAWDTLLSIRAESQETLVFPVPASTLGDWWRAAVRVTGLKGLRIHDLRKTFLTRCRRKGVALEVGMTLSDHHDVKTALRVYRQVDDADLLRAVDRVPCERDAKVEVVNGL
jgi:integrase